MCCELSGGHFAEDRRTFCRKKADILPNMGGHSVEWWTFCRSPRARARFFRSPASPTRGLAVHPTRGRRPPAPEASMRLDGGVHWRVGESGREFPRGVRGGNASGMSPLRTGHMDHAGSCLVISGSSPGGAAASASRAGGIRRRFPVRQGAGEAERRTKIPGRF